MSMDELLEKVSEAKGMPPALAKRSAEARAKKTGEPVEAVLAEWAGVDVGAVSAAAAPPAAPAAAPSTTEAAPAPDTPSAEDVEVYEATVADVAPVDHGEGEEDETASVGVPKERRGGYPTWLAAAFILIPLLAVAYVVVSPNGPDCGTAGQLDIDPATGLAVNCDGSEYGSSVVDFFSQGAAIYAQCSACHGNGGEGGVGPAFAGGAVLATFPAGQCSDHVEWVGLGTSGWPDATYGATNKPVGGVGVMPAFGNALTPEELRAVVLYERVQFGGEPVEEAQIDCGLVTEDGELIPEDQMVQASDG
jgi:mono/diheme cytochrome c family protein